MRGSSVTFEEELNTKCLGASLACQKQEAGWHLVMSSGLIIGSFEPWRLLGQGRILITGEDHGHIFGFPEPVDAESKFNELVKSATIERVAVDPVTGDLAIELSGPLVVQVLTMSAGYESWWMFENNEWIGGGANGGSL